MSLQHPPRQRASGDRSFGAVIPPNRLLAAVVVSLTFSASLGVCQEAESPTPEARPDSSATLTAAAIDGAAQDVNESTQLDDATKTHIKDLYARAKVKLEELAKQQEAAVRFKSWVEHAAENLQQMRDRKLSSPEPYDLDGAADLELEELVAIRAAIERDLADAGARLEAAQAEPQRRLNRRSEFSAELDAARTVLEQTQSQAATFAGNDDPSAVVQARQTLLRARHQAALATVAALEAERDAYEAEGELPRLRNDLALAQVKQLEQDMGRLLEIIAKRRIRDAERQRSDAEQAKRNAPDVLKPFAQQSIDWAARRLELAKEIRQASASRQEVSHQLRFWQDDFARVKQRTHGEDSADSIGRKLLEKQAKLPSRYLLQHNLRDTESRLGQQELYDLEDRRAELSDVHEAAKAALAELRRNDIELPADSEPILQGLFALEVPILDSLLEDAHRLYALRIATAEDQTKLIDLLTDYRAFVDEQILWLRTAQFEDFRHTLQAAAWLFHPKSWGEAVTGFGSRFLGKPSWEKLLGFGLILLLALLLVYRKKIEQNNEESGRIASHISCQTIWPTTQAVLLTGLLAAPLPLLLWCVAWGVADASAPVLRVTANSCRILAFGVFTAEFFRQVCRPMGLAEAHFGWSPRSVWQAGSSLGLFVLAGVPLALVYVIFQRQHNPEYQASLGRLSLVGFLLLLAFVLYRVFQPLSGLLTEVLEQDSNSLLNRYRKAWYLIVVIIPVVLAIQAMRGFPYTAYRITLDLWRASELAFLLCLLGAVLFRWVRVERRRLRKAQIVQGRRRAAEGETSEASDLHALAEKAEQVDLVAMDHQTRRLIIGVLALTGLIGLWAIWHKEVAALTPVLEKALWHVEGVGGAMQPITVGAILLAGLVAAAMVMASRNVPGLVDMLSVGRLKLESSARYAISTLLQYAITLVGLLVVCGLVGITWSRAQWLIAALGVGLGFGLQEVVANFVCGILLLFERPIRVGDIVTLGDTTGAVIQIRSRATTVRNWDRQEVVIPNKELITGRIVNWTLTDSINRIAIQVGIAYGADTNRAAEMLREIAQENENVLEDPKPVVTFEEFADSSLTFVLRAFLAKVEDRLSTIHALHTRIKQRFEGEGIEIAFPQRDLHIRSVDQAEPSGNFPSTPTAPGPSRRSTAAASQQPSNP